MAALPTRIKQHIRDHFTTTSSSPFATKSSTIQTTLGYPLHFDPEWPQLWKTFQTFFPDPGNFVPYIAAVMVAWCDTFIIWLEDEANEEDVEKLLEGVQRGRVDLLLEISESSAIRPTTKWSPEKAAFIITLPKSAPVQTHTISSGFSTDFTSLFTASPPLQAHPGPSSSSSSSNNNTSTGTGTAQTPNLESWSLDSPDSSRGVLTPVSSIYPLRSVGGHHHPAFGGGGGNNAAGLGGEDFLPEMSTIQRPEELLKRPPYWLIVRQEGRNRVTVQGSHTGSLGLLEGYLKRWVRGDVRIVDRPPIVNINLQESSFGLGLLNDTLILEANRHREVTAMLVLVFVESVLGYELLPGSGDGVVWEYRRLRGFK